MDNFIPPRFCGLGQPIINCKGFQLTTLFKRFLFLNIFLIMTNRADPVTKYLIHKTSVLSILIHGIITLPDSMPYDELVQTT